MAMVAMEWASILDYGDLSAVPCRWDMAWGYQVPTYWAQVSSIMSTRTSPSVSISREYGMTTRVLTTSTDIIIQNLK